MICSADKRVGSPKAKTGRESCQKAKSVYREKYLSGDAWAFCSGNDVWFYSAPERRQYFGGWPVADSGRLFRAQKKRPFSGDILGILVFLGHLFPAELFAGLQRGRTACLLLSPVCQGTWTGQLHQLFLPV